jgi:lysophospholipase L1-like esterase
MITLKQSIGDSVTHTVPLSWGGQSFEPDHTWLLLLSVKANKADADRFALFQKALGAGITVAGSSATFEVVPIDTQEAPARLYYGDIQAQSTETGEVRTVAEFEILLNQDVSRGNQSTIEIHTTQPAYPNGPAGPPNVLSIGTVTTGDPGTQAAATISGTSPEQVLNFQIPRGAQGVQGPVGPAGPVGATGSQGATGPAGPAGPAGPTGPTSPAADVTNASVNAAIAADPASTREVLDVKSTPETRLIDRMKAAGIWQSCVHLKIFGKDTTERGYATNFAPGTFTHVRNGTWRNSNTATSIPMAASLGSSTIFVAMTGGQQAEVGTERTVLGISTSGSFPWASLFRFYKATSGDLNVQTVGGGAQLIFGPSGTTLTSGATPRTYTAILDTSAKTVTIGVDGVIQNPVSYVHSNPSNMAQILLPGMAATYSVVAIFNRALTSAETIAMDDATRDTVMGSRTNIVLEGDSIPGFYVDNQRFWERYLLGSASDWAGEGKFIPISTGGHSTTDILAEWPAQINPYIAQGAIDRSVLVLWVGANDLGNFTAVQRPVETIHENMRTLWAQAKARGFIVVAVVPYYRAARTADGAALRDLILADEGTLYDVVIDMHAAFLEAAGSTYWTNAAYIGDGVHPTTLAAQQVIANAFNAVASRVFQ